MYTRMYCFVVEVDCKHFFKALFRSKMFFNCHRDVFWGVFCLLKKIIPLYV